VKGAGSSVARRVPLPSRSKVIATGDAGFFLPANRHLSGMGF
jgi:hypothetical protein